NDAGDEEDRPTPFEDLGDHSCLFGLAGVGTGQVLGAELAVDGLVDGQPVLRTKGPAGVPFDLSTCLKGTFGGLFGGQAEALLLEGRPVFEFAAGDVAEGEVEGAPVGLVAESVEQVEEDLAG